MLMPEHFNGDPDVMAEESKSSLVSENTPQVSAIRPKIPNLWITAPDLWFEAVEAQFATCSPPITKEETKCDYLIANLSEDVAVKVRHLIRNRDRNKPYSILKAAILDAILGSSEERYQRFLVGLTLGGDTATNLLNRLYGLIVGLDVPYCLLRTQFIKALPKEIRPALCNMKSDTPLLELAKEADLMLSNLALPEIGVSTSLNALCVSELSNEFTPLINQISDAVVAKISRNAPPFRNHRRQPTSQRNFSLCWYHKRFGSSASRCISPCTWQSSQGN